MKDNTGMPLNSVFVAIHAEPHYWAVHFYQDEVPFIVVLHVVKVSLQHLRTVQVQRLDWVLDNRDTGRTEDHLLKDQAHLQLHLVTHGVPYLLLPRQLLRGQCFLLHQLPLSRYLQYHHLHQANQVVENTTEPEGWFIGFIRICNCNLVFV